MKRKPIVFWAGLITILTLACGLGSPTAVSQETGVETIVAATLTAIAAQTQPAPVSTTEAAGFPVSAPGSSFIIPPGLAFDAVFESVPASLDPQAPIWDYYPAYAKFTLEGYLLKDKFFQPQISVYPTAEFEQANEGAARIINDLRTLLANPATPLPLNLPFLPLFNAGQVFHSNPEFITFQNGTGIRYLTQFGQDISPVNNYSMFYTFQGITSDNAYYITAILPVNAAFLVEYPSPEYPTPTDGIPFNWDDYTEADAYFNAITQKLNATPADSFTPSLSALDTMIRSLLVTGTQ